MSKIIKFPTKQYLKGNKYFEDYINIKDLLLRNVDQKVLHKITQEILNTIQKKRDFFSCGNGGSATTAEHLSCDFSKGSCTNTNLNINEFNFNYTNDEIKILKKIAEWPRCIEVASLRLEPHRIPIYLYELSSEFHTYWNMGKDDPSKRFINDQKKIPDDKLVFLKVISNVIRSGMNIVGVNSPEKM